MVTETKDSQLANKYRCLVDRLRQKIPKHKNIDSGHLCVSEIKMQMTRENKQQDVFSDKTAPKIKIAIVNIKLQTPWLEN